MIAMKLPEVRRLALSLPEAVAQPHHDLVSFRVRGKIFATLAKDEQHLHVFVDEMMREQALVLHPQSIEKLWWGEKVMGVRVAFSGIDEPALKKLLLNAWQRKAPRQLLAQTG